MLYISTGGIKNQTAKETSIDFYENGISSIELSGGAYSDSYKNDLIDLSAEINFQVHNYFPPPKKPFVFNLASSDTELLNQSIDHVRTAMNLAIDLGRPTYSFHAGFRINPRVSELGKALSETSLCEREVALEIFGNTLLKLAEEARQLGVNLLVENNVLNPRNLKTFGEDPLLLTEPNEIEFLFKNMPANVGLLLDVAHLKVSSNSLGFNPNEALKQLKKYIKGYHLSDNDGKSDSNEIVTKDSWFWSDVENNMDYYSLEIYNVSTQQLLEQYNFVSETLFREK